ncbi:MAG: YciI family protein [Pseudomonadota bacterium]
MHFLIRCYDGPDSAGPREAHLAAHLAWVKANQDPLRVAGPVLDADGAMVGSCYVIEADDLAAARTWFEGDPYAAAGFWERVDITPFMPVAGAWAGGCQW